MASLQATTLSAFVKQCRELESGIAWAGVVPQWRGLREEWVASLGACTTLEGAAELMCVLAACLHHPALAPGFAVADWAVRVRTVAHHSIRGRPLGECTLAAVVVRAALRCAPT